jgi:hypothetical protein
MNKKFYNNQPKKLHTPFIKLELKANMLQRQKAKTKNSLKTEHTGAQITAFG